MNNYPTINEYASHKQWMLILMNIKSPSKYMIKPTPDILYVIILNMNFQMFDSLQTYYLQKKNRLMRLFNFFFR